ncbi:hypothetical protein RCL1_004474 [Eukaryota sp. TZLM3-RCL]
MPPKKRPRFDPSLFIDEEADVQEDTEEEELSAEEGYLSPSEANAAEAQLYAPRPRRSEEYFDQLAERYQQRVAEEPESEVYYPEEVQISGPKVVTKRPPSINDPKLWLCRVRVGQEQMAVLQLIQKHFNTCSDPTNPANSLICSALSVPFAKGFIYVEAYKSSDVTTAAKGIKNILVDATFNRPIQVPLSEMTAVLKPKDTSTELEVGSFVRILRGLYKNDLARIHYFEAGSSKAVLEIVPRLVYSQDSGARKRLTSKHRPAARLFDPEEASRNSLHTDQKTDHVTGEEIYTCQNQKFTTNGFLLKTVSVSGFHLVTELTHDLLMHNPHFAHVFKSMGGVRLASAEIQEGELVRVKRGELKGLVGVVTSKVGTDRYIIKPKNVDFQDLVEFLKEDLAKLFEVGNRVRIVGGDFMGETGFVVSVNPSDPDKVVVISDLNSSELKVESSQLKLEKGVVIGQSKVGKFSLRDLVQINPATVGIVTKIDAGRLVVLLSSGLIGTYLLTEVKPFRSHSSALDKNQHTVKVNDQVTIMEGQFAHKPARILGIFKSYLFLDCPSAQENGGLLVATGRIVVNASSLTLATSLSGVSTPTPNLSSPMPLYQTSSPHSKSQSQNPKLFIKTLRGSKPDEQLKGKLITITKGTFKGYKGKIVSATEHQITAQLPANGQKVTVAREYVKLLDTSYSDTMQGEMSAYTPAVTSIYYQSPKSLSFESPSYSAPSTPLHSAPVHYPEPAPTPEVVKQVVPVSTVSMPNWLHPNVFVNYKNIKNDGRVEIHEGVLRSFTETSYPESLSLTINPMHNGSLDELHPFTCSYLVGSEPQVFKVKPVKGDFVVVFPDPESDSTEIHYGELKTEYGSDVVIAATTEGKGMLIVNIEQVAKLWKS